MRRQSIIGVDVSDSSIKVLELDEHGNSIAYGSSPLSEGVISDGVILNKELFAHTLTEILKNTKPKILYSEEILLRAVLCVPESKLFSHDIVVPANIKKTDIKNFVFEESKKIIPFDLEHMYWDYRLASTDTQTHATFIGIPKVSLDSYVEAFTHANVTPTLIVGELLALGNALLPPTPLDEDQIIVDIGAHTTNIGLFTVDEVASLSVTVWKGGDALTAVIAKKLDISEQEAEDLKRKQGLLETANDELTATTKEFLKDTIEAIQNLKTYAQAKQPRPIKQIILVGGTALLPGIAPYISSVVGISASVANPLTHIHNTDVLENTTPALFFANVIGLALQGHEGFESKINLLQQYRYSDGALPKVPLALVDIRSFSDVKYVLFQALSRVHVYASHSLSWVRPHFKFNGKLLGSVAILVGAFLFLGWVIVKYTHLIQ